MKKRIGIIGCGNVSSPYMSWLRKCPGIELDSCADLEFFRAETKAQQYNITAHTIQDLLADSKIEIVLNATKPKTHGAINRAILEAGKHLYVEKPFTLDVGEAEQLLDFARQKDLRIGAAPDTFLGGGLQTCRKLIDEGAIGTPVAATIHVAHRGHESWHPDPEHHYQPGGGPMFDVGPYYLGALVALLGPIHRVTGSARASLPERTIGSEKRMGQKIAVEVPTHYAGVYDFADGVVLNLMLSFDVWHHRLPAFEIYGTEGSLALPDPEGYGGPVLLRRAQDKEWNEVPLTHTDQAGRGIGVVDMAHALFSHRPHRASAELAIHVLEAMFALEKATRTQGHVQLDTTCERPEPLPTGLAAGEMDL